MVLCSSWILVVVWGICIRERIFFCMWVFLEVVNIIKGVLFLIVFIMLVRMVLLMVMLSDLLMKVKFCIVVVMLMLLILFCVM